MQPKAFITGASSGIGRATAYRLAAKGYDLVINARRSNELAQLKSELESKFKVNVANLVFDISDRSACEAAFATNENEFKNLSVLINNAGMARGSDPMQEANLDDWEQMIDTNVKGLLFVTRLALPFLQKSLSGHIVNVGSVAGRWVYPGGGVYCATKFAVRALTEGLRLDLHGTGLRITNISPGMVETNFSQVRFQDEAKAKAVYQGVDALTADDIAECVEWSLSRPSRVNIQEMVVFPTDQAAVTMVNRGK